MEALLNGSPKQKSFSTTRNLWIATGCVCIGAISVGFVLGYSSPAIPQLQKQALLTDEQASWFGSLITIGALFGSLIAGWTVDKLGRKITAVISVIPFIIGWWMIYATNKVLYFYTGRFVTGLATGHMLAAVPVYIAEVSTKDLRGMLGTGTQLGITIGILLAYSLGMVLDWRGLAIVGMLLPCLCAICMYFMPETPRYLIMKGKKPEALKALYFLRGKNADVEDEFRDIANSFDSSSGISCSEMTKPELFAPLKLSLLLMFFQQFSGINVIMFYTVSILQDSGFKDTGELGTVIIGAVQVVMSIVASVMMDRAGRRVLLLTSSISMGLACGTLGWYYYQTASAVGVNNLTWLALVSLIIYITGFSLGWGPVPMLMTSEVFPSQARGMTNALAIGFNWTCAFIITKEFHTLQTIIGKAGSFWFFQFWLLLSIVFILKMVPETKGKSLEDIELYFMGRVMHNVRGV